jgi:hypothetical protein
MSTDLKIQIKKTFNAFQVLLMIPFGGENPQTTGPFA